MNKQELIGKIEGLETEAENTKFRKAFYSVKARCLYFVAQLDELQAEKVEVPDFVAVWYESNKHKLERAIIDVACSMEKGEFPYNLPFEDWFIDPENHPIETLIRMKDGYTVKPKRWVVRLDNGRYVNDFQEAKFCVGIGITLEMDCLPPFKFTDKPKAEAVATLVEGSVEEV